MKKRNIVLIVILLTVFICSIGFAGSQDEPKIAKGQLLPASQIIRSERLISENVKSFTVFEEDFESGLGLWDASGSWGIGAPASGPYSGHESTNCAGTTLDGNYSNNADDWLISITITLPEISHPSGKIKLYFWEWFYIESGYDYGKVKISTDGGSSWTEVSARSGSSDWRKTMVDLTSYQNELIQLAFQFTSDGSVTYSGWYVDDIRIELEEPEPLTATMISLNSQNFPFIYMNVAVDTFGVGLPDLAQSDFQVYENGTLQTDYFEVTPPETGGGSRRADIVFLMDNSGSMIEEINAVSNNVLDFVDNLVTSGVDLALGLCRYGQWENNGNPIIEDNGILTSDANYFKYDVWARNYADGGFEPGYYAIVQSANSFSFRPGAQKIFIIITDETPDQGGATESDVLNTCVNNSITLFALTESDLYGDFSSITSATNGAYFDIYSNFDEILDYISSQVANTYLVRYRSSDPEYNGILRIVEVTVSYQGNQATAAGSYVPGSAPQIERTQRTLDLHTQSWEEGTELTIEVEFTDEIEPYTESATLYYKNTTESVYQPVSMYQTGKGEIWQGIIPGSDVETPGLDYYITATDGQSTSSDPSVDPMSNPYQIAVLPNEAPVITHTPVTASPVNTPIAISADITDNTNELVYAGLFYRKTGQLIYQEVEMVNTYEDRYEAEIPADYVTVDGLDYYIKAKDNFGVESYHGTPDNPHFIEAYFLIWPGDTDNNGVVDEEDILLIGVYWRNTGSPRSSISFEWKANDYPEGWEPSIASLADCNGDGEVNITDVLAICLNWDKTHTTVLESPFVPQNLEPYRDNFVEIYNSLGNSEIEIKIRNYIAERFDLPIVDIAKVNKLCQNYPNPFNPDNSGFNSGGTIISFSLDTENPSNAKIEIYNVKGQKVKIIEGGEWRLENGKYTVTWDGRDENNKPVSSGIYFYRLQNDNKVIDCKKMLIIR